MGYLASGEIFENMLQLKRFSLYFEINLNRKWLVSYKYSDISYRNTREFGPGHVPQENLEIIVAICMVRLRGIILMIVPLFFTKITITGKHLATLLLWVMLNCSTRNLKKDML